MGAFTKVGRGRGLACMGARYKYMVGVLQRHYRAVESVSFEGENSTIPFNRQSGNGGEWVDFY